MQRGTRPIAPITRLRGAPRRHRTAFPSPHRPEADVGLCRHADCLSSDVVGNSCRSRPAPDSTRPSCTLSSRRVQAGDYRPVRFESVIETPKRGERVLSVIAAKVRGTEPDDPKILISFDDVTEARAAARQLSEARRAAEKANLVKSRFLAAASHDLRQPLQTLTMLQAVLQRRTSDAKTLEILEKWGARWGNMSSILSALLDINQLEAGAISPSIRGIFDRRGSRPVLRWRAPRSPG